RDAPPGRGVKATGGWPVQPEEVLDAEHVAECVDGRGRIPDLLDAHAQPVEQRARWNGERGLGQTGARGPQYLALHEPAEGQGPGDQDRDDPGPAAHETARCNAASNTC